MIYAKHPTLGNKHAPASERDRMEAEGWVIWPRSAEAKAGIVEVRPVPIADGPVEAKPVKRGPGRPRKVV